MKILLYPDICIYTINRKNPKLLERLRSYSIGEVGISAVIYILFISPSQAQPENALLRGYDSRFFCLIFPCRP
jgi:predicted nucleic acid-binding protein